MFWDPLKNLKFFQGAVINLAIEMILINQFEYDEIGDDDGLREL